MREFAAMFDSTTFNWSIIFRDGLEKIWYVHAPNAGDETTAVEIADALNAKALAEWKSVNG